MNKSIFSGLVCMILLLVFGGEARAQNGAEAMKREYESGNRRPAFLKEYIALLKTGDASQVAPVLDEYLMQLPEKERYSKENLTDVISYLDMPNRRTIVDIVQNWSEVPSHGEMKKELGKKIGDVFMAWMFERLRSEDDKEGCDLPLVPTDAATPFTPAQTCLVNMWPAYVGDNVDALVSGIRGVFSLPGQVAGLSELFIFSTYINSILENADLKQSRETLEIFRKALVKYPDGQYDSILRPMIVNLEGKIMMIEMGED